MSGRIRQGRCPDPLALVSEKRVIGRVLESCMNGRRLRHPPLRPLLLLAWLLGTASSTAGVSGSKQRNPLNSETFLSLVEDVDCKLLAPQYCTVRVCVLRSMHACDATHAALNGTCSGDREEIRFLIYT